MLTPTPYIVKMFEYIVLDVQSKTGIQVHYEHGTRQNIDQALISFDKSGNSQYKFPLIGLIQPFTEKASKVQRVESDIDFKIVIATRTDPNYTPDQREANSFVPVLRPLFRQLLESIKRSGYFTVTANDKLSLSHTDLYEWGEKSSQVFCDYVDAILIDNLQLSIKEFNCA